MDTRPSAAGPTVSGADADQLFSLLYQELRKLAAAQLRRIGAGGTLQPTALVHEAYLKLSGRAGLSWEERRHFFAAAAQAMRELIIDHARRKRAKRRGGGQAPVALDEGAELTIAGLGTDEVLALNDALSRLEAEHPRKAEVAILRHFGGLSEQEIAELSGVTTRTVEREWRFARAYLHAILASASA